LTSTAAECCGSSLLLALCTRMRIFVFLIFFAASAWCWSGLSFYLNPSSEEKALLQASHRPDWAEQTEGLTSLEAEASLARDGRVLEAMKSAFGSGVLLLLGIFILRRRRIRWPIAFSLPPNPPDIDALRESVKQHPLALSRQAAHFYGSRRQRCRTARGRLKSQIDRLFSTSELTPESSQRHNSPGLSQEPDPRSVVRFMAMSGI